MKWKNMSEDDKLDVIGHITIISGCVALILVVFFQIARALIHG